MENIDEDGPGQFIKVVGRQLKAAREGLGLTQDEVARRLTANGHPTTRVTVTRTESGSRPFTLNDMNAFADVLGISTSQFFQTAEDDVSENSQQADFLFERVVSFTTMERNLDAIQRCLDDLRSFIAAEKRIVGVRQVSLTERMNDGEHHEEA